MSLKEQINEAIKEAMKAKMQTELLALRSIKAKILLAETAEGRTGELTAEDEMKLLMKEAKQRKESAEVFAQQGRPELAEKEMAELAVIERFLPKMLSEEELKARLQAIIAEAGATSAKDMGKVMGLATKQLAGQADGKLISTLVKNLLG
jgi:uncharacterized protein